MTDLLEDEIQDDELPENKEENINLEFAENKEIEEDQETVQKKVKFNNADDIKVIPPLTDIQDFFDKQDAQKRKLRNRKPIDYKKLQNWKLN